MHIVVNTRMLIPGKLDGIGWFAHEVLQRITQEMPDVQFTFLFDRPFDPQFIYGPNVKGKVLFPPARHPLLYRWYFGVSVPLALKSLKPDLFFSPDGFLSINSSVKQIPVIHDINFEHRPQDLPKAYRNYYRSFFKRFALKAEEIITVSEYSANDIASFYKVDRSKIHVAYNGANEAYMPIDTAEKTEIRQEISNGHDYFVFVGNFSYRKNIHGIVKAFDAYKKKGGSAKLVLVGNPLWRYKEMIEALESTEFEKEIVFAGHLALSKLVKVVAAANALVFPSYFEGFGIPIVEAFRSGIPVITANTTSLPEVAGDAAFIADPDDFEKISNYFFEIENNENQRFKLIQNGFERAELFQWQNTANKVKSVLLNSLNNL
ncbi:MAG: glycosyltransferase family 4 protein [Salibacteraceae bacterium]|nr:glycosyltransferase family 4 protein [Salibacteraceae bacterium]